MGKSPGKWIKTLLFGKKSSRSSAGKGREALRPVNDKESWVATKDPPAEFAANSPSISLPITAANTDKNGGNSELEKGVPSNLPSDGGVLSPVSLAAESQGPGGSIALNDPERFREEQAAVKAQAAFRGYLARRAFRALRGIIRLQALVRGHLVRRQAVATLHSLQGIVKLQALVRGRRVRHSDLGLEVYKICILEKGAKPFGWLARKDKLSTNVFFCKLLASSPTALPLRMRYAHGEPNSAWNWLERWTISHFWEPVSLPKKVAVDSKVHTKKATAHSAEIAESGRPKRNVRRNASVNTDSSSLTHPTSEIEKPKRNLRKMSSAPVADPVQEHPTNELEKVKRSLRKVATSTTEASSDQTDLEPEKPKRSFKKVSSSPSDVPDQIVGDSSEKMKKDTSAALVIPLDIETATLKPVTIDGQVDVLQPDQLAVELLPLDISGNDGNVSVTNGKISSKDDQICLENQKSSKRRVSLPAKGDENGLPNAPTLPSYMAATESAKAKLRAQGSPRFGSEAIEKNGITRRHSLPNSTNGKVSSPSVRAQKLVQVSGKGGSKNDRSMLASRDGNEKVITEWRR